MRDLLNGQSIRVDNHKSAQESKAREGWHIDKNFEKSGKRGKVEIYPDGKIVNRTDRNIEKEIRKVLEKDPKKLRDFVDLSKKLFDKWENGSVPVGKAREYAGNIASALGLDGKIRKEYVEGVGDKVISYTSIHEQDGQMYFISQSKKRIFVGEGKVGISIATRYRDSNE